MISVFVERLYRVSLHSAGGGSESNSGGGSGSSSLQRQLRSHVRGRSVRGCASVSGGGGSSGGLWSWRDGHSLQRRIQPVLAVLNTSSLQLLTSEGKKPNHTFRQKKARRTSYERTLNKECNYKSIHQGFFFFFRKPDNVEH